MFILKNSTLMPISDVALTQRLERFKKFNIPVNMNVSFAEETLSCSPGHQTCTNTHDKCCPTGKCCGTSADVCGSGSCCNHCNTYASCDYDSCSQCTERLQCGWCASTGACVPAVSSSGPLVGSCSDFDWLSSDCSGGDSGDEGFDASMIFD